MSPLSRCIEVVSLLFIFFSHGAVFAFSLSSLPFHCYFAAQEQCFSIAWSLFLCCIPGGHLSTVSSQEVGGPCAGMRLLVAVSILDVNEHTKCDLLHFLLISASAEPLSAYIDYGTAPLGSPGNSMPL